MRNSAAVAVITRGIALHLTEVLANSIVFLSHDSRSTPLLRESDA
jgi:hypothetical protein